MEQNILYSIGASNLVSLLSKSLESAVDMHHTDCVICSCAYRLQTWYTDYNTKMIPIALQVSGPFKVILSFIVNGRGGGGSDKKN